MKCPRCNEPGALQDAPQAHKFETWRRPYQCANGHRFHTVEVIEPTSPVVRHQFSKLLREARRA